jgi:hypothetical protein
MWRRDKRRAVSPTFFSLIPIHVISIFKSLLDAEIGFSLNFNWPPTTWNDVTYVDFLFYERFFSRALDQIKKYQKSVASDSKHPSLPSMNSPSFLHK